MKKLIIAFTGLISICFAALVIGILFLSNLDLNNYKDWISEKFYEQTGRELTISGNIQSSFYPWLGLELEGLSISNPENFSVSGQSDREFLYSDYAAFRIKLMPLLNQEYEIDTVQLRGTRLNLAVNAAGASNWSSFSATEEQANQDTGSDSGAISFNKLIIGGVAVEDVQVNYVNQVNDQTITASDINISIPELIYGEPLQLDMTFRLNSTNPALVSDISLNSTVIYDLDNNIYGLNDLTLDFLDSQLQADLRSDNGAVSGSINFSSERTRELFALFGQSELSEHIDNMQLLVFLDGDTDTIRFSPFDLNIDVSGSPLKTPAQVHLFTNAELNLDDENLMLNDFNLSALGLILDGKLNISNFMSAATIAGELDLQSFNPKELNRLVDFDLPPTRDPAVLEKIAFSSSFTANAEAAELNRFILELDNTMVSGSLQANSFDTLDLNFDISIDSIDIDRYLGPQQTNNPNTTTSANDELPLSTLRELNLDGDIRIGSLFVSGLTLNDVALGMNADQGLITLTPVQARLYQGTYSGTLSLDARSNIPAFSMQSSFQNISVAPLSTDFIGASYLSGIGTINLDLNAQGRDTQTLISNLNGTADLNLNEGIFQGADVGAILSQLETMLRSRRLINVNRGEQTAFDKLSASIQISNGIARSNDLLIQSPGFNVSGRGILANLQNESLNFDLLATVNPATATLESQEYDIGGYSLPINCSGNMSSPRCLPDINSIFSAAVTNVIQEGVGSLLNRVLGSGATESAPATGTTNSAPATDETGEPNQNNQQQSNPAQELINQALDRLRR